MLHHFTRAAALTVASLLASQATHASEGLQLERWRSYAGVTWEVPKDGNIPAPFAASVNAPIAGLHFDSRGTAYVSTPRLVAPGAPATLSRLNTAIKQGPAQLTAFPSTQSNAVDGPPELSLRNVLGFYVDHRNGWLWALDMGFVAGEAEAPKGGQKVLVLDLASGRTVKRFPLDSVADRSGSFLNDIAVDERRRVAYIADSGMRSAPHNQVGLIVVNFDSGKVRRVLDRHPSLQVEAGVQVMSHGAEVWPGQPLLIGINGIALSPTGDRLYWTVTTGTHAYAVSTAVLRQPNASDAQISTKIVNLGAVGGNTDGIVANARGNLFITDVSRNGIVQYQPGTGKMSLLAADDGVFWPDTPAIGPNGDLFFTSSALNQHFAGAVKSGEERYEIWRLPLKR
ncbi:L-dopachrome tautomerase-related protein [Rhodoferax sp. WC2427]|uniref:L-dopachrome tautomerase-related protein n=1 Tax=Rhodoferax sp. WC2427 TaxID=3234144 RepID=UPI0034660481